MSGVYWEDDWENAENSVNDALSKSLAKRMMSLFALMLGVMATSLVP